MTSRSIDDIGRLAANHAFTKHAASFNNPALNGTSDDPLQIATPEDFAAHVVRVLSASDTMTVEGPTNQAWRQTSYFYQESTNTLITVPTNPAQTPTAFRPKDGIAEFNRKLDELAVIDARRPTPTHVVDRKSVHEQHYQTHEPRPQSRSEASLRTRHSRTINRSTGDN